MAHGHLFVIRDFAKSSSVRGIVEKRIVTEAVATAWFFQQFSLDRCAKRSNQLAAIDQRNHTDKARPAIGSSPHVPEKQSVVLRVGCSGPGIACREHTRRSPQRVDFET